MADPRLTFYYDLFNPESYLFGEFVALSGLRSPIWQPVSYGALAGKDPAVDSSPEYRSDIERWSKELGLQPLRWPSQWPCDAHDAALVAVFAQQIGRVVAFSLAAMRQAFAGGSSLLGQETVLLAAAACEMHPRAVLQTLKSVKTEDHLAAANSQAADAGVTALPALEVEGELFYGYKNISLAFSELSV